MNQHGNHGAFCQALVRGLATPDMTKGERQGSLLVVLVFVFFSLL